MGIHLRVLYESYPMNANMTGLCSFQISLQFRALDGSSRSIRRVNSNILVVADFCQNKMMQKKMIKTLANEYSSESTQQELSNEYQHDRV